MKTVKLALIALVAFLSLALSGCGLIWSDPTVPEGSTTPPSPPTEFTFTPSGTLRAGSITSGMEVGTFGKNENSQGIGDFTFSLPYNSNFEVSGEKLKTKSSSISVGTYPLVVTARDEGGKSVDKTINIVVKPAFDIQSAVIRAAAPDKLDVTFTEAVIMTDVAGFTLGSLSVTLSSTTAPSPDAPDTEGYSAAWQFALSGPATASATSATISYDNTNGTVYLKGETSKAPDIAAATIFTNVIALTAGTWVTGTISAGTEHWYEISATGTGNYYLWLNQTGMGYGDGSKTGRVYNSVYNSSGGEVLSSASSSYGYYDSGRSFPVTSGEKYYVKLINYTPGTYGVAFITTQLPPGSATAVTLAPDTWVSDTIAVGTEKWYEITATGTGYCYLWLNQTGGGFGDGSKNGRVSSIVFNSYAYPVENESSSAYYTSPRSFSVTSGEKYYIRLTNYTPGTYAVAFTTTPLPIGYAAATAAAVSITPDVWGDNTIAAAADSDKWYKFTASNTGTYHLWLNQSAAGRGSGWGDGTKNGGVSNVVYSDNGAVSVSYSGDYFALGGSFTVISGQTYYIRLTYYSAGDYAIAVTATTIRPMTATEFAQFTTDIASATSLSSGTFVTGTSGVSSGGTDAKWHSYTVTAGTPYTISIDPSEPCNNVNIWGYYADGSSVALLRTNLHSYNSDTAFTPSISGPVYIKIWPYSSFYTSKVYGLKITP
jgi:hypothetical protein